MGRAPSGRWQRVRPSAVRQAGNGAPPLLLATLPRLLLTAGPGSLAPLSNTLLDRKRYPGGRNIQKINRYSCVLPGNCRSLAPAGRMLPTQSTGHHVAGPA